MLTTLARSLVPTAVLVAMLSAPASAQIDPFADMEADFRVTNSDLKIIEEVEGELLSATSGEPSREWTNPDNGHSGTIRLLRTFSKQGFNCRELRYDLRIESKFWTFDIPLCQVENGDWKIAF